MYTHTCMYINVYAYIYTDIHIYIYIHIHMHLYTHICTHIYMCMHMHTYVQMENLSNNASSKSMWQKISDVIKFTNMTLLHFELRQMSQNVLLFWILATKLCLHFTFGFCSQRRILVQWLRWVFTTQERKKKDKTWTSYFRYHWRYWYSVWKQGSSLDSVVLLSFCFGCCSPLVHWDCTGVIETCNKYNQTQ